LEAAIENAKIANQQSSGPTFWKTRANVNAQYSKYSPGERLKS